MIGSFKRYFTYLFIALIPSVPILLWVLSSPLSARFTGFQSTLLSFGQIAGLLGMSLFALTLVFNTRLPFLEDLFGGLNKVFPLHHLLGKVTFIILLSHPLFLSIGYSNSSLQKAILFLLPGADKAKNFGTFAIGILIVLLFITFFVRLPYNKWIGSHRFLGIAFIVAAFHLYLIDSDVYFFKPLRFYMMGIVSLGILAYSYRTLFPDIFVKKNSYFVDKVNLLKNDIIELVLNPFNGKITFIPGQFVFIKFKKFLPPEQHSFSITSAPFEKNLKLVIKVLGDFTGLLKTVPSNTPVEIEGPYGRFGKTDYPERKQIWIAGGIGITPFLSMARNLSHASPEADLYYSVKTPQEAVFVQELKQISLKNKNFRLLLWVSERQGRISLEQIEKTTNNLLQKEIFLCGPIPMIKSFKEQLSQRGFPSAQLHSEEFQLYPF